jgi:putative membrane protein
MRPKSTATGLCVFVFLAGASLALAATPTRHSQQQQQDKQFLRTIAIADMTEAHAAEMAQTTAKEEPVKDFGQTVAKDETQEYEQLTVLASKAGANVPKGIDARKNPVIRTLMSRKGADFDRDFLRYEIADERRVIEALQREAAHGQNPDIKAWAGRIVAARQQELQTAQSLAN